MPTEPCSAQSESRTRKRARPTLRVGAQAAPLFRLAYLGKSQVVPDQRCASVPDSNQRSSPGKGAVFAARPRDQKAEAVGLEPTSGAWPPPVFKTGSSSGRMTSVRLSSGGWNRTRAPTAGWSSWFRARCHYQQQLPRNVFADFGEKDLNLHNLVQSQAAYR